MKNLRMLLPMIVFLVGMHGNSALSEEAGYTGSEALAEVFAALQADLSSQKQLTERPRPIQLAESTGPCGGTCYAGSLDGSGTPRTQNKECADDARPITTNDGVCDCYSIYNFQQQCN